jgi:hypothetical protein
MAGRPSRSMTVWGTLACECHRESTAWVTFPPNMSSGMRGPPIAWKPPGCTASGSVSIDGVRTVST